MPSPTALPPPEPTVTRCTGCGAWCWRIDAHGCPTCRQLAAQTTDMEKSA